MRQCRYLETGVAEQKQLKRATTNLNAEPMFDRATDGLISRPMVDPAPHGSAQPAGPVLLRAPRRTDHIEPDTNESPADGRRHTRRAQRE